jgi:hypothetical protein
MSLKFKAALFFEVEIALIREIDLFPFEPKPASYNKKQSDFLSLENLSDPEGNRTIVLKSS